MQLKRTLRFVPVLGAAIMLATVLPTNASSHREAPLISEDPVADNTDTYAFVSPDAPDKVTLIANWVPLQQPAAGPNFHKFGDDVLYQVHVDNNGDAEPDITYEWRFTTQVQNSDTFLYNTGPISSLTDPNFNVRQTYTVSMVKNGARSVIATGVPTPPVNIGPRSTPNYDALANAAIRTVGDTKLFAGQRDDAFYVDLGSVFDLGGLRPFNAAHVIPRPAEAGVDGVAGFNTHTIAIQVPKASLTNNGANPIIGVWAQTKRFQVRVLEAGLPGTPPRQQGRWVNVSRLGMPLVNEVVIPLGMKDRFNNSDPRNDAQFGQYVLDPELARLIPVLYPGVQVPPAPRNDLAAIFLTGIPGLNQPPNVKPAEMIRLNTDIAPTAPVGQGNRLGILAGDNAGFPNGRRLEDDTVDISLRALAGATPFTPSFNVSPNNVLSDGVTANDKPLLPNFPYLPSPHQGYEQK
ncbi:MAG: DUF4331 domain-containing protein [Actinomycetota bacterium]